MAKLEIDARLLEPEGESPITENFNRVMKFIDDGGTGDGAEKTQVDFNATLENNVITGELDESVSDFAFVQNHDYLIHIYLPLVTLTGDLDDTYTMVLKDKDGNTVNINNMFQKDITKTVTVGDMCQIQDYDTGIGYSWEFNAHYRKIEDNGTNHYNLYTDTIVRETVSAMTGANLHLGISNSKLKSGTIVICTSNYENNGTTYNKGHQYLVTSEFVDGELILGTEDITVVQTA